jgi:hypothetical protein
MTGVGSSAAWPSSVRRHLKIRKTIKAITIISPTTANKPLINASFYELE